MDKKGYAVSCGMGILFLILLFLGGCSTAQKQAVKSGRVTRHVTRGRITDDVLFFRDLQEVDLYNDGKKEIIAICALSTAPSGVKVIRFNNGGGEILFEQAFSTANTRFVIKKGTPTIIFEEIDSSGRKSIRNYSWNGTDFILE